MKPPIAIREALYTNGSIRIIDKNPVVLFVYGWQLRFTTCSKRATD